MKEIELFLCQNCRNVYDPYEFAEAKCPVCGSVDGIKLEFTGYECYKCRTFNAKELRITNCKLCGEPLNMAVKQYKGWIR